jgi:NADPH-dependent curcumin reductase CurA
MLWPVARQLHDELVARKKLHYRDSIVQGPDAAPLAFPGMLKGQNFCKQIVKMIWA